MSSEHDQSVPQQTLLPLIKSLDGICGEIEAAEQLLKIQILTNADSLCEKHKNIDPSLANSVEDLVKHPIRNVNGRLRRARLVLDGIKKSLS